MALIHNKPNIILAGFMGTGKSAVGEEVARRLGLPLIDTDQQIEAAAGKAVSQIFTEDGEAAFRRLEAEVCQTLAARRDQVIATGGGALLNEATRQAFIAGGVVICLQASLEDIIQRVGDDPARPLFGSRDQVAALLASRKELYDNLPCQIDTTGKTVEQVAGEVIALWKQHS